MPNPAIIGGVVLVLCICIAVGIYFATKGGDSPAPAPATRSSGIPATGASPSGTLVAGATSPSYGKAGYKPIPLTNLPSKFTLKNTATGKFWGQSGDQVTDATSGATLTAVSKSDLYSQTGTGMYALTLSSDPTKFIRHSGFVMWYHSYAPGNFDFSWQLFLKDGTTDQVIVWNPYPGNNVGMYVQADGSRQKIADGAPTVYTLAPVTSTTSTYVPEPYEK